MFIQVGLLGHVLYEGVLSRCEYIMNYIVHSKNCDCVEKN